jgi:uncharacterized protein YcbX
VPPGCDTVAVAPRVAWIFVAPVKGMALARREEVRVEQFGVRDDRRFYLIGEDGRLLNGKQLAPLVQIDADWDEDGGKLTLTFPGDQVVAGTVELGEPVATTFYGRRLVEGRLVGGPFSEALSTFVGRPLRLVQTDEPTAASDRGRGIVTVLSTASLEALREAAGIDHPVDARRFRMLFGVEGVEPHEEDSWLRRRVRIGEAEIDLRGNVGRCLVTSRHPESGARNLPTLDVLAAYRSGIETTEALPFGVWGTVAQPGVVRLGDPIVA